MPEHYCRICEQEGCQNHDCIFYSLTDSETGLLNSAKEIIEYGRREVLNEKGFTTPHMMYVSSGFLKMFIESRHGKRFLLQILGMNRFVVTSIFGDIYTPAGVESLTPVRICYFEMETLMQVASMNGRFAVDLLRSFNVNGNLRFSRLSSIALKQTRGRLADAILYLDKYFGETVVPELLSRKDIADLAGISHENAIRTLQEFREEGLIGMDKKRISILNHEGLKRASIIG